MRLPAVVIFLALSFGCVNAMADTDYTCLNSCVNNGGNYSVCMPKCTYNAPKPKPTALKNAGTAHDQFKAPTSGGNVLPLNSHHSGQEQPVDYDCRDRCMQQGLQYQLCSEHCVKK